MQDLNKINEYLMKKKECFIIEKNQEDILGEKVNPNIVFGMLANLDTWGYTIDKEMIPMLFELSEDTFVNNFYNPLVQVLKEIKGDDVSHDNFLFKNFPDSCRSMDPHELSDLRFMSYFTGMFDSIFDTNLTHEIEWDGKKEERKEKSEISTDRLRIIGIGNLEMFEKMNHNLLSSRAALSPFDKEIIEFALKSEDVKNENIIPEEIPFKENWAYLFKFAFENPEIKIPMEFKNFNDFVRACVSLSDGDVSLAEKPKLRSFKSEERRRLLSMLNSAAIKNPEAVKESMMSPSNKRFINNVLKKGWHMDQNYKKQSWAVSKVADRAMKEYSKRGQFEKCINKGEFIDAAKVAASISAGELARKMNLLLTKCKASEEAEICKIFEKVANKVDVKVLLDVKNTINNTNDKAVKVAFPKGSTMYAHAFENHRASGKQISPVMKSKLNIIIDNAICEKLKNNKPLGKVYIDPQLKNCPAPFSSRNESGENRCAERGSRIDIKPEAKAIRAFCYKKDKHDAFYDLSATFLDKNFNMVEQCSWTNLRTQGEHPLAVHSGDNASIKNGYTEFIDIDLKQLEALTKDKNVAYVAFHVLSYNHVPFNQVDRIFFGIMEREGIATDALPKEEVEKLKKMPGFDNNDVSAGRFTNIYYHQLTQEHRDYLGYKQEKVFDPATVEFRNDIISKGTANIPMIYDIENKKFIVADIECRGESPFIHVNNIPKAEIITEELSVHAKETLKEMGYSKEEIDKLQVEVIKNPEKFEAMKNGSGLFAPLKGTVTVEELHGAAAQACYAIVHLEKPNMYDVAMYNVEARGGELVDSVAEADTIFVVTKDDLHEIKESAEIITIYDRDIITADLMATNEFVQEELENEIL